MIYDIYDMIYDNIRYKIVYQRSEENIIQTLLRIRIGLLS